MKHKGRWFNVFIAFQLLLHISFSSTDAFAKEIESAAINFTVKPSQNVIVKPQNTNAEGNLDFHLIPSGKSTNINRDPIDVIFIFDKSGSMNESGKNPNKFQSAKDAMAGAVDFFKENAGPKDNFAFIPFSTDVESGVGFRPLDIKGGLDDIKKKVNSLSANGGTNYTQSFEKAIEIFNGSSTKIKGEKENNKYIIFMTDGEPTVSTNSEKLTFNEIKCGIFGLNCKYTGKKITDEVIVNYVLYGSKPYSKRDANFTYNGIGYEKDITIKETVEAIRAQALNKVKLLADQNIKLFSIGFGNDTEVDMGYLRTLSSTTGAVARQATPENISSIFRDISGDVDTPSITPEVKVDLGKFNGKVKVIDGFGATQNGNIASMKSTFKFPLNQEVKDPVDLSLPLSFSEVGTYTFDTITMSYTDLDGKFVEKKQGPVTIEVKADAPPSFKGEMSIEGTVNTPDNLIKVSGSNEKSNEFKVNYALTPYGLEDNKVKGNLTNIKIIQPLPDGVFIVPTTGVSSVTTSDGKRAAQINISNTVNYSLGKFTPEKITASLTLKGEWALNNIKLPLASVIYEDSRFGPQSGSIPASNQIINLKVRLKEVPNNAYDGDSSGIITKVDLNQNGLKLAQTEFPNNYGLQNKPIKDLKFVDRNTGIEVTYFDDEKVTIYLVTDFEMTGVKTGDKYKHNDKAPEAINVNLSKFVAGKGVKYYYSIKNEKTTNDWIEFNPSESILVNTPSLNTIKVKAVGGFTISNTPIEKNIYIEKLIEKITITPNPIDVDINKSKAFEIKIEPIDATNKKVDISILDKSKAQLLDEHTVIGKEKGETYLVVKTTDGSEIEGKVKIIVNDPYVILKEIKFKKPVYKIKKGQKLALKELLILNPEKATNKELESVASSLSKSVSVIQEGTEWFIEGKEPGIATITVTAEEQKDKNKTKPSASALFEVEGNDSDKGPPGGGKW